MNVTMYIGILFTVIGVAAVVTAYLQTNVLVFIGGVVIVGCGATLYKSGLKS